MKHSVLTVGKTAIKTSYCIPSPKMRGTSEANAFSAEPYGSALICSLLAERLGGNGLLCSKIGNDFYGARLKQFCENEGLETRFLYTSAEVPTGSYVVLDAFGQKVVFDGASSILRDDEIENAMISYPDIAVVDMSTEEPIARAAFEYARKYGVKAIASFSDACAASDRPYIKGCEVLLADAESVRAMTGINPQTPDLCVKACMRLHYEYKPKYIVLRLHERGALYYDGKHCEFYPGIDSSEKFGELASDAFVAAFALDYSKGNGIGHACTAANIVSGITELKSRSVFELPDADEVNEYVRKNELKI